MSKLLLALTLLFLPIFAQAELSQTDLQAILKDRIDGLQILAKNTTFLEAVRAQNAKDMSLDDIKKIDEDWKAGKSTLIEELQTNKVGSFLKNIIVQQADQYSEAFITDAKGANVATYPATSDYWQGDEEKFTKSYADGKGEIFIGPVAFDESTKVNAVQVSVPLLYNKQVVGVLVIGVKVSVLEAEKLKGEK